MLLCQYTLVYRWWPIANLSNCEFIHQRKGGTKQQKKKERKERVRTRMIYFTSEMSKNSPRKRTLTIENDSEWIDLFEGTCCCRRRRWMRLPLGLRWCGFIKLWTWWMEIIVIIIITCLSLFDSSGSGLLGLNGFMKKGGSYNIIYVCHQTMAKCVLPYNTW